jgi:hypothetical protein
MQKSIAIAMLFLVTRRGIALVFCKAKNINLSYALQKTSVTVQKRSTGAFFSLRSLPLYFTII